jgi:HlyD family secretion protein
MPEAPPSVRAGAREALRAAAATVGQWVSHPARFSEQVGRFVAWAKANPRRALLGGGGGLVALLLVIKALPEGPRGPHLVAAVQEGPFEVEIVESGTLQALRSVSYSSSIPGGQAKIIHLVPEGTQAEEGDVLIKFDATPFEEELQRTEAQLAQARAERIKAEQDLKLLRIRNKEELQEARDKLRLAELELSSVTEGKGKVAEAESAAKLSQAKRELEKAVSNHEDLKPLLEEGFITKLELDRARQAVEKAEEDLELLEIKHQTYMDYTRPAEIEGSKATLYNAKEELRQLEHATGYRLSQAQAAFELARSKTAELTGKLELHQQNVSRCEILATVSGMVIYREVFFGSEKRKVQVGDQVWPNQPLIMLPDLSQMTVETQVRETDIYKVEKDQKVAISVDAYPELALEGEVSFIGTLAQEEHGRRAGKYFRITILVREVDPRLRPGMTARIELLVDRIENALYVPLESIFERGGRLFCWVIRDGKPKAQEILTGASNDNHIVIEAGLEAGEKVLLRNPTEGDPAVGDTAPDFLDIIMPDPSQTR